MVAITVHASVHPSVPPLHAGSLPRLPALRSQEEAETEGMCSPGADGGRGRSGGCPPWEQSEGAATLPGAGQGPLILRKEVKMSCSKQAVGKAAREGEPSVSVWTENWPRGSKKHSKF